MELVKNILFDLLAAISLASILLTVTYLGTNLLYRFFKLPKYMMYHEYKRNENLYDLKNKIVVSKDGKISYTCLIDDLDEQEKILRKAINYTKEIKELQEKYSR